MRASPAKASFDALIDSNAQWFGWIDAESKFKGMLKDKIPWDALSKGERDFVSSHLKTATPENQILLNSFYMTMVSGFEEYLREKIREVTKAYSTSNKKYLEISEKVRNTHIQETARLLRRIDSPPDYMTLNLEELCRGLGSCIPGSESVQLNPDAFANVESLVLLVNFFDRAKILGIKADLNVLGRNAQVRGALGFPADTGAKEVSKRLQETLIVIRRNRNRIAHAGGNAADVTNELITSHRKLLRELVAAIDGLVR